MRRYSDSKHNLEEEEEAMKKKQYRKEKDDYDETVAFGFSFRHFYCFFSLLFALYVTYFVAAFYFYLSLFFIFLQLIKSHRFLIIFHLNQNFNDIKIICFFVISLKK